MIPKFGELMLPVLTVCGGRDRIHRKELTEILADQFDLTVEERNQLKDSGRETLFLNRVGWADFHLRKAGLVNSNRGVISITEEGKRLLERKPEKIDKRYLFDIFQNIKNT